MLFQNEHHLYNEYKSHLISQLSAITDSSCIAKKGISGDEYASMFYFTVLHKMSLVPCYENELLCFLRGIIEILDYVSCKIVCLLSSIGNYKQRLQNIICHVKRLGSSVRFFEHYLKCCIEHCIKKLESCSGTSNNLVRCIVGYIMRITKILLGLFGFCTEMTVQVERWVERLGSVVLSQSRLCLIESELGKQREQIQSCVSRLRCIWCSLCKGYPENILVELTSIIESTTKPLESANDLAREIRYIAKNDRETMDSLISSLCGICPSIQKTVLCLKFSVGLFTLCTKGILCLLNSLGCSISCIIPDFKAYLCVIERNLKFIRSEKNSALSRIGSFDTVILSTKDSAENLQLGIDSYWSELDSFIDVKVFLKCSAKSIKVNLYGLQSRFMRENKNGSSVSRATNSNEHNNFTSKQVEYVYDLIWSLMSNLAVFESKFVLSKLYECHKKKERIDDILKEVVCDCTVFFDCREKQNCMSYILHYGNILGNFNEKEIRNIVKEDRNHICICLVIRYNVYPRFVKCIYLLSDIIKDLYSSCTRKFDKFTKSLTSDLYRSKIALFYIEMVEEVLAVVEDRCRIKHHKVYSNKVFHCFCISHDGLYYTYLISTLIYISSLVENMFHNPYETTGDSIQSLSNVISELSHFEFYSSKSCPVTSSLKETSTDHRTTFILGSYSTSNLALVSGSTATYLEGIKELLFAIRFDRNSISMFYQRYSEMVFFLYGKETIGHLKHRNLIQVSTIVSNEYVKSLCDERRRCSCSRNIPCGCVNCRIYRKTLHLFIKRIEMRSYQIFNDALVEALIKHQIILNSFELLYKILEKTKIAIRDSMVVTRNNKVSEESSTGKKKYAKVFEGRSDNNYTYNDAYRINTSRAHGSLKYIIIKLVLILIIVVMTIFIRVKIDIDDDYIK